MGFFTKKRWPELSLSEIQKRARLLVIDDQDFYYLGLFEKDGYSIEKWDDVEDLPKFEMGYYDIILLDIHGVGREHSKDQGFGILKHLRQTSPAQIIVAYSNADWSLKYQDFFKMADCVLDKRKDYVEFKRKVDQLLKERFSQDFYVERMAAYLSAHISDADKIRELTKKSIEKRSVEKLENYLQDKIEDKNVVSAALQIVQIAIQIAAVCYAK